MAIKKFEELKNTALNMTPVRVSVAAGEDREVLESLKQAQEIGLIDSAVITGDKKKIKDLFNELNINVKKFTIVDAANYHDAASQAVKAINTDKADILVKGMLDTSIFFKAVLDKEQGMRKSSVLSNLSLFEMDTYHKLIGVTDNAMIPFPTLKEKKEIINNTKTLWASLGIQEPKVAILAAIEKINDAMPATVDAACLCKMSERNQLSGFVLDGPLAYDAAISKDAAEIKKIKSDVAGDPDLLLLPSLEAANMLGKVFKFQGKAESGGILLGATHPIVLNSRSDSAKKRLNSMFIARLLLK